MAPVSALVFSPSRLHHVHQRCPTLLRPPSQATPLSGPDDPWVTGFSPQLTLNSRYFITLPFLFLLLYYTFKNIFFLKVLKNLRQTSSPWYNYYILCIKVQVVCINLWDNLYFQHVQDRTAWALRPCRTHAMSCLGHALHQVSVVQVHILILIIFDDYAFTTAFLLFLFFFRTFDWISRRQKIKQEYSSSGIRTRVP